jgi:dihydrofolate reductase
MRKVIVSEFLSLDGVMEASEEWQPAYFSDDVAADLKAEILASEALLLGRVTYEIFAAYWPYQIKNESGIADKLNSERKYVVSSTLTKVAWNNSILIQENVTEEVRNLKQQPGGDIRVIGSATLVRSLMETDLIDEYWLMVHPLILGKGMRLFDGRMVKTGLELIESKVFSSGVVLLRYRPVRGEV